MSRAAGNGLVHPFHHQYFTSSVSSDSLFFHFICSILAFSQFVYLKSLFLCLIPPHCFFIVLFCLINLYHVIVSLLPPPILPYFPCLSPLVYLHPSFLPPFLLDSSCNEPINWSNTAVATGRLGGGWM